jgi:ribokinase
VQISSPEQRNLHTVAAQVTEGERRHVICVGDVMVDIVATLPGPLLAGSDTPGPIRLLGGGSAANTAAWLVRAGTPATLVARVGPEADPLRTVAVGDLPAEVRAGLITDPGRPTGRCVVLVHADGERTMVPDAGANAGLVPDDVRADLLRPGRHLHVSGYALFGAGHAAARHALAAARAAGLTVSVDAASTGPLRAAGVDAFLGWVGTDALLFANVDEAEVLTGLADPAEAARSLAARVGAAVVKLGDRGALGAGPGGLATARAGPVRVVDTTGAGDAFAAGYLDAIGRGADAMAALSAGNALAAEACGRIGGRP